MSDFKEQQQDRIQEGKELKHEDEMKDLSQMSSKQLPGAEKSIMSKISEGISNVANTISDKVGLSEKPIEGHEDLDKKTVKQQKKINAEILKKGAEEGFEGSKGEEWVNRIPEDLKKEIQTVKISKLLRHVPQDGDKPEGKSIFRQISEGISNVANSISDKVGLSEKPIEGHEDLDKKTIKQQKKINAEILKKGAEEGFEGSKGDEWVNRIPEDLKKEIQTVKISKLLRHVPQDGDKAEGLSFFSKISGGLTTFAEKLGLADKVIEGHEDLDKETRKQIKKVNKEILKMGAEKAKETPKTNEWENQLPKQLKKEIEGASEDLTSQTKENKKTASPSKPSFAANLSEKISQGVSVLKDKFNTQKEEETTTTTQDDGTKTFKTVKDGFKENVDDLKHEQRIEELGQAELASQNPFKPLTSADNEETRTLGEKMKGGLTDASQKLSSTLGEATQKVKSTFSKDTTAVDKENARQTA